MNEIADEHRRFPPLWFGPTLSFHLQQVYILLHLQHPLSFIHPRNSSFVISLLTLELDLSSMKFAGIDINKWSNNSPLTNDKIGPTIITWIGFGIKMKSEEKI